MRHSDALELRRLKLKAAIRGTKMQHSGDKVLYIISRDSKVSPEYTVRRLVLRDGVGEAIPLARCATLEEARAALPAGLQLRETNDAHDDSVTTETWY